MKLFEKYHLLILLFEVTVISVMVSYICMNKALDWDEAYTFQMITKNSIRGIIRETSMDVHPPLYYLLLWFFSKCFGTDFFVLKLFSVLFTILTMFLGIIYVCKNWGWKSAFGFILVVGLGPRFLYFSVNIRMYSMELFFVTWCALLAYSILKDGKKIDWVLFVISALGGVYTHYFAAVPLAFIYGYLLIGLLLQKKKISSFSWSCFATILAYLPWISVVFTTFKREGVGRKIDGSKINFAELCDWAFTTNIEWSNWMPLILYLLAIFLLFAMWKDNDSQERLFLLMCATIVIFTYVISRLIASMNQHFFDNRYIFGALALFWLFLSIAYSKCGTNVFATYTVWLAIMVLSSFVIQKSKELGTVDYMEATYQLLEPVRAEETVIYDYDTYEVLYGAHMPEQKFIYIDDVDFENLDKDYIYMLGWSGKWFSTETVERYHIECETVGELRFEEGVAGVLLYKLSFDK